MEWVMCNVMECPFCQFCIFELDCTPKMKYEAREESKNENIIPYYEIPDCFQGSDLKANI